jgi:hypothetical protein
LGVIVQGNGNGTFTLTPRDGDACTWDYFYPTADFVARKYTTGCSGDVSAESQMRLTLGFETGGGAIFVTITGVGGVIVGVFRADATFTSCEDDYAGSNSNGFCTGIIDGNKWAGRSGTFDATPNFS